MVRMVRVNSRAAVLGETNSCSPGRTCPPPSTLVTEVLSIGRACPPGRHGVKGYPYGHDRLMYRAGGSEPPTCIGPGRKPCRTPVLPVPCPIMTARLAP